VQTTLGGRKGEEGELKRGARKAEQEKSGKVEVVMKVGAQRRG